MLKKSSVAAVLSLSVSIAALPSGASADGSAFVGGLIGGALGSAIVNHSQQQQQKRVYVQKRTAPRSTVSSYQREQNREVQAALNYFGFPAGTPDGVLGANSRAAIRGYQSFMVSNYAPYNVSYGATGLLSEPERMLLVSCYQRAMVGGAYVGQRIATRQMGPRGFLLDCRDDQYGGGMQASAPQAQPAPMPAQQAAPMAPVAPAAPVMEAAAPAPVAPAPAAALPVAAAALAVAAAPEPEVEAPKPGGAMPNFLRGSGSSMGSFCNRVSMTTGTNGGYVTAAAMTDPQQALGEQFCLARTYAMEQGESLAAAVQGFSMAEIQEQCEAFAPTMTEYQARLVTQSPAEAGAALQNFVVSTGVSPTQLSGNARICLGIGYSSDNAELALASSMILVGLGEEAYAELLGHHLMNGFSTPKRPDRADQWYEIAIDALDSGASPLVPASGTGRTELLRAAVAGESGTPAQPVLKDASANPGEAKAFLMPMGGASSN